MTNSKARANALAALKAAMDSLTEESFKQYRSHSYAAGYLESAMQRLAAEKLALKDIKDLAQNLQRGADHVKGKTVA